MKPFFRLFVPPCIYILASVIRSAVVYYQNRNLPKVRLNSKSGKSLCVIGNGPSLNQSLEQNLNEIKTMDCIAVNQFATTSYFSLLQPSAYLIADGAYFQEIDSLSSRLQKIVLSTIKCLNDVVNWEMSLYLPFHAYNSYFYREIKKNRNIKVEFYNCNAPIRYLIGSKLLYWMWNHNYIGHLAQTVLNTCLGLGIEMGYSTIYIIGADTSWHETYWMDQRTNELYSVDKHFYGEEKIKIFKDNKQCEPAKLHEELRNVTNALESYWILANYAKFNNVQIFNASSYSWIDAFKRKQL